MAAGVCAFAGLPTAALAAPRDFRIATKPLAEALVDFAVQAEVSINTAGARGCRRMGNPVAGRLENSEALRRLLQGTGCGFEAIDARTYRIVRLAPAVPARSPTVVSPAAPVPPSGPTDMSEVIVTATRSPSVASRLPYSVSAVSGDVLTRQGAEDANTVALLTPGLTVTNLGPGRDKLIVRGLSDGGLTGTVQSTVGIYLDETRLTYSAPDPDLRLVDIERVEVLRGPQGSLYGAGSIGGVFHIVSRQPELGDWSAFASAQTSFTSGGEQSYAVEGMLNAPLWSDTVAIRAVGYSEVDGGYIDNRLTGRDDVNRTTRSGLRALVRAELSPRWALSAGVVSQTISSDDTQYVIAGAPGLTRDTRVAEPHHNDFAAGWLTLSGSLDLARFRWTTAYVNHRLNSRYDASSALPDFGAVLGPAAAYDERFSSGTWLSELTLTSPLGARVPWLFGAFYSEGHEDQTSNLRATTDIYSELRRDEVSEVSLYGEVSYPWRRWTLTVGGRYFWASRETASDIAAPGIGTADFADHIGESGFAPKLVVRYQLTDRWIVYAQAAEGYRTGGFNTGGPIGQVFGTPGSNFEPARRYAGDELWSYEAGTKWIDPDLGLTLQAAAYIVDWSDIQSTQLLGSGVPYTANLGDGRSFGLELEGVWSLGDLELRGNLLLNEPELDRPNPGFPANPDTPLAGVARVSAGSALHYEREIQAGLIVSLDGRVAYIGPSQLTFDAATAPRMGGYVTSFAAAGLERGPWRLAVYIDNLGNSRGDTFAYGNPFTLRSQSQATPQRPVTGGLRLEWRF